MPSEQRRLGAGGPMVFPLALGCSSMSSPGASRADDRESIATIQEAIEAGVNLIDTADFYGHGHNELLIAKAIEGRRDKVLLSVKFNGLRSPEGAFLGIDSRPAAVKNFLGYSLTRLGVDHIDVYRPARLDPNVPIEETMGALAELVHAGYVRHIGLSEVGPDTIRRAQSVHPLCDVQMEYALMSRGPEQAILPVLHELGIATTAYGVLVHGLLTGHAHPAEPGGPNAHLPRFQPENFARNQKLVDALTQVAQAKHVTTAQLAIAWVLAKQPTAIAVVGARRRTTLQGSLAALHIHLTADDLVQIEQAVPPEAVAGTRYSAPLMKMLDSESTQ